MTDSTAHGSQALAGKRILITRAPHQASELADRLRALGAEPILIPAIEIAPPSSYAVLDAALVKLSTFDMVAFTSGNAVEGFHQRAHTLGLTPVPRRIAVVGPSTARAVASIGLHANVVPPTFTAESLSQTLAPEAAGRRILLVHVEDGPTVLRDALVAAGADVTMAAAYRNRIPQTSLEAITLLFSRAEGYPDAITFTSASTAGNLVLLIESAGLKLPSGIIRASIGPITSQALSDLGLPPQVEAEESTIPGLVAALVAYFTP